MMEVEFATLRQYLEKRLGGTVQIEELYQLGSETTGAAALKQFGYGRPFLVSYRVDNREERLVFHCVDRNAFGHEREDDRVATVWLDFKTFNHLPRHVSALDMVAYTKEGQMQSLDTVEEVFLVVSYCPGRLYADDLIRIRDEGTIRPLDLKRTEALATYLAEIHQVKHADPMLWQRRLRDLIGRWSKVGDN